MVDKSIEYNGMPLTWQKIAPGNTVTTIAAGVWKYTEYEIGYDSCDFTGGFLEGQVITGATSGAMGVVISATITAGTILGGDAAGKIRFHSWNGINFTDDEKIKVAADADVADINGSVPVACTDDYPYKETLAHGVMIQAVTNPQMIAFGAKKVLTDQTAKVGVVLPANSTTFITDASAIRNINVVDATAGTAGSTIFVGHF